MTNNFNPGFDREKAAFIELANRGEGLSPIEYIYAGNASFESVLASYLKGGMIDINMLYVTNIDATDIVTVTLEAKIATIDTAYITTIYSDNIYNKDKITTKDLFVSHDLTVGSTSSLASATFHTTDFLIAGVVTSFALATFDVVSGFESHDITTLFSLVSPAVSINAPAVSINYVEGALKLGAVGIYAGTLMDINAPKIQIGDPTKLGVKTLTVSMKPDISFTCTSATINLTGSSLIDLTSEADINLKSSTLLLDAGNLCDISANEVVINTSATTTLTASTLAIEAGDINMNGGSVNITGTGNVSLKAAGSISVDSPKTIPGIPFPIVSEAVLIAELLPVEGVIFFTLPNVVTCVDGILTTVDFEVTITCIV